MSRERDNDLPIHTREADLQDLEPHERTIERIAAAYFGACDRAARAIRAVKSRLSRSEEER